MFRKWTASLFDEPGYYLMKVNGGILLGSIGKAQVLGSNYEDVTGEKMTLEGAMKLSVWDIPSLFVPTDSLPQGFPIEAYYSACNVIEAHLIYEPEDPITRGKYWRDMMILLYGSIWCSYEELVSNLIEFMKGYGLSISYDDD